METEKISNFLSDADRESSRFAPRKWSVINNESNGNYSHHNLIKVLTKSIESSLCDYSDAQILVRGNIAVAEVALNNCAPFRKCKTEMNEIYVDEAEFIDIAMPMYNLIEYSDNFSDTSWSLWQFKREEIEENVDLTVNDQHIPNKSSLFKDKSSLITNKDGVKIAVPLKYLRIFWRSLEMPLINCKVELSLAWTPNCVPSHLDGASTFMIHNAKFYVPVLTLSTDDNAKLSNQLSEGFKTPIYWNKYKVVPKRSYDANASIKELIDSSCQGVKTLFVLSYEGGTNRVTVDSHKRYSLPKVKIKNYNFEIDGRNFYDQPINDLSRQYNEVRKVSTGQDDDYITGCVLDFAHVRGNCRLTVANLSKKNALDADLRAIQQIYFTGKVETDAVIYYISEKPKETTLEFYKRTTKIL